MWTCLANWHSIQEHSTRSFSIYEELLASWRLSSIRTTSCLAKSMCSSKASVWGTSLISTLQVLSMSKFLTSRRTRLDSPILSFLETRAAWVATSPSQSTHQAWITNRITTRISLNANHRDLVSPKHWTSTKFQEFRECSHLFKTTKPSHHYTTSWETKIKIRLNRLSTRTTQAA